MSTGEQPVVWRGVALTGVIGGGLFVALVIGGTWVYEQVAGQGWFAGLDEPVLQAMVGSRTPVAEDVVTAFTNLGRALPMVTLGLLFTTALWLDSRRRSVWVLMLVAAAGSITFTLVGKPAFARTRPPLVDAVPPYETSFSFPSGHTLNSTVVVGMAAYLTIWLITRRWVRVVAVVFAVFWSLSMGLSRVYLGHHWLSDVVFAWLVGLAWLTLLITVHQVLLRRTEPAPADFRSPAALP